MDPPPERTVGRRREVPAMRNVFAMLGLLTVSAMTAHGAVVPGFVERTDRFGQAAAPAAAEGAWTADSRNGWTDDTGERR